MRHRARALGDVRDSSPENWDPPWRELRVHILLMMYGQTVDALDEHCEKLRSFLLPGVRELGPERRGLVKRYIVKLRGR